LSDHRQRLRSFRTHWWFNKPLGISPIECARRGWFNVGLDTLECACCGEDLRVERDGETWLVNGLPVSAKGQEPLSSAAWAEVLIKGHGPFCPWRSHEVGIADPSKLSDHELADAVEERLKGLRASLSVRPLLAEGSTTPDEGGEQKAVDTLEALARAGWEFAGRSHCGTEFLSCAFCLRMIAVQSFTHLPVARSDCSEVPGGGFSSEDCGEPPQKATRLSEATPGAGSNVKLPRAPAPGLWIPAPPQARGAVTATAAAGAPVAATVYMDPHALHRFYCPVYSRADDDLGPLAVRIINARAEAARAAGAGEAEAAGCPDGQLKGSTAEGSAVARAEELLRALDVLLQPA